MNASPRRWVALVLTATTGACFHYVPLQEPPRRGTPVRVELRRPVEVSLLDVTANNVVQVRGEFVSSQAEGMVLSAFAVRSQNGGEIVGQGETVTLPGDAVGLVEQKRISVVRSALFGVALAAAGYLVQLGLRGATGGNEGGGGGGTTR